jgi:uncharacterized protein
MRIINKTKRTTIANKTKHCTSLLARMRGLMFSSSFNGFDGYYLNPCNSIHTFFMHFPIDVVMVDRDLKVVKLIEKLKPWRLTRIYLKVQSTIELPAGTINSDLVQLGDNLELIND